MDISKSYNELGCRHRADGISRLVTGKRKKGSFIGRGQSYKQKDETRRITRGGLILTGTWGEVASGREAISGRGGGSPRRKRSAHNQGEYAGKREGVSVGEKLLYEGGAFTFHKTR